VIKLSGRYSDTNYIFNDLMNMKLWYPIIRLIASGSGSIENFSEKLIKKPLFDNKVISKLNKRKLAAEAEDGTEKDLEEFIHTYLEDKMEEIMNWSDFIFFNNKINKYDIKDEYQDEDIKDMNDYELGLFIFLHIRDIISGDIGLHKRNTAFFLFFSFLIEKDLLYIKEDKNRVERERYLKFIDDFKEFLNFHNYTCYTNVGKLLVWNFKKIFNLFNVYEDLNLITHYNEGYHVFGDLDYFHFFFKDIFKTLFQEKTIDDAYAGEVLVSIEDFLTYIHNYYFYLPFLTTTERKLPILIDQVIRYAIKKKWIVISELGDQQEYQMEHDDKIRHMYIKRRVKFTDDR